MTSNTPSPDTTHSTPISMGFALFLLASIAVGGWLLWSQDGFSPQQEPAASTSKPVSSGGAGNYLAALHASRTRANLSAAESQREALAFKPDDQELLRKAFFVALKAGKMQDAITYAQQLPDETDPDALDIYVLATGYSLRQLTLLADAIKRNDMAQAQRIVKQHVNFGEQRAAFPSMFTTIMTQWIDDKSPNKWEELLASTKEVAQLNAIVQGQRALILERNGKIDQADKIWTKTLQSDTSLPSWLLQQALRFFTVHNLKDKQTLLLTTIAQKQHDVWHMSEEWQGWSDYFQRKDTQTLTAHSGIAGWWYMASLLFTSQEDAWMSYHLLNLALHLQPNFWAATMQIAGLHEQEKRYGDAATTYLTIPEESPYWPQAQLEAAQNLARHGKLEEAMSRAQSIALAYPKSPVPWLHIGDMLRAESRFADAAQAYDKSIARLGTAQKQDWPLFYMRGICYERSKQWQKAEADFLKALELHPNNPDVQNYLGYSWLTQGMHVERATKLIEQAVKARPQDGHIVDSMGWALYQLGRYAEAVAHLERAVELMPGDATVTDHLADAYWRLGRKREATYQWERALLFKPEDDLKETLNDKLKNGLGAATPITQSDSPLNDQ